MATSVQMQIDGLKPLLRTLRQMPDIMSSRVLVPAAMRGARRIASGIRKFIPIQRRMRKPHTHYRDAVTQVVREYKNTHSVVAVIGAESGLAPHAAIVEEGTKDRWTNHKSRYRKLAVRVRPIIKAGRLRYVTEKQRQSIGSFQKKNKKPTYYRGRMPAFHPIARGVESTKSDVGTQLKADIESGIKREFTEAQIGRS